MKTFSMVTNTQPFLQHWRSCTVSAIHNPSSTKPVQLEELHLENSRVVTPELERLTGIVDDLKAEVSKCRPGEKGGLVPAIADVGLRKRRSTSPINI